MSSISSPEIVVSVDTPPIAETIANVNQKQNAPHGNGSAFDILDICDISSLPTRVISPQDNATSLPKESSERIKSLHPQTLTAFVNKVLPPKEPLIDGLIYRRDRIGLIGRRRHGKTTLLSNLALAGSLGLSEYLGYRIPRHFNVLSLYLEDDARELQDKLRCMLHDRETTNRFHLYTRDDFFHRKITVNANHQGFKNYVRQVCDAAKPDLLIVDNLGKLLGADYNDGPKIEQTVWFFINVAEQFNAALLIATHPRKQAKGKGERVTLENPDEFYEEAIGSTNFINTMGSLWGIERNSKTGHANLLLGTQRLNGETSLTIAEKSDDDWFHVISDRQKLFEKVVNTPQRKQAWQLLPTTPLTYTEAKTLVKRAISSSDTFTNWWNALKRNRLLIESPEENGRWTKQGDVLSDVTM